MKRRRRAEANFARGMKRLTNIRRQLGVSRTAVGEAIGVSRQRIDDIENGKGEAYGVQVTGIFNYLNKEAVKVGVAVYTLEEVFMQVTEGHVQ